MLAKIDIRPETRLEDLPIMLRVSEVAVVLRVTRQHVYQIIRDGSIKAVKVGKAVRISRSALVSFMEGGNDVTRP